MPKPLDDLTPKTLRGIKSLAARLKGVLKLSHHDALNEAARRGGFASFHHARMALAAPGEVLEPILHRVVVSCAWKGNVEGPAGALSTEVWLSKPVTESLGPSTRRQVVGRSTLQLRASDHLVVGTVYGRGAAGEELAEAVRALQFVDATGLVPSREDPSPRQAHHIPGADHVTNWVEPATGRLLQLLEPYRGGLRTPEARAWCDEYGMTFAELPWGIYNGGIWTTCYSLVSVENAELLKQVIRAMGKDRPPINRFIEGRRVEEFGTVTEARERTKRRRQWAAAQAERPETPRRTPRPRSHRPAAQLDVATHLAMGEALRRFERACYGRDAVTSALRSL